MLLWLKGKTHLKKKLCVKMNKKIRIHLYKNLSQSI